MIPNTDTTRGAVNLGVGGMQVHGIGRLRGFFSCVSNKAPPAAKMPWGFLFFVKMRRYNLK